MKLRLLHFAAPMVLAAMRCLGHAMFVSPVEGAIGVRAVYDDGSPAAFSETRVFAPGADDVPVLTGMTDSNGYFMFRPDRVGDWQVAVDDGMGHADTVAIAVAGDRLSVIDTGGPPPRMPRAYGLVAGLGLIFGVFGWSAYFRTQWSRSRRTCRPASGDAAPGT